MESPYRSIRAAYVARGAREYYQQHGSAYRNPHEPAIGELIAAVVRDWPVNVTHVFDLAAGSGEVTLALQACCGDDLMTVDAADPFTADAYAQRTGRSCQPLSFEDIAAGGLADRHFSLIACSFALHLADSSRLPSICQAMAITSPRLLILTPHKRPMIQPAWGWTMTHEMLLNRVRARLYESALHTSGSSPSGGG
ncbi:MAG TPA: class I SAM-dependent methyltransferase [Tepidisphaeraceae bacterium]|jgi:hypothetical protein